jgi:lysine-N-methylase
MSCCEVWQVVVDTESYDYYNALTTNYGKFIRSNIEECDGEFCFKIKNGRCAFLNQSKLCDIHLNVGSEHMAKTCRKYPDFTLETQCYKVIGQSLSCPFVAKEILANKEVLKFSVFGKGNSNPYESFVFDTFAEILNMIFNIKGTYNHIVKEILNYTLKMQKIISKDFHKDEVYIDGEIPTIHKCIDTLESMEFLTDEWKNIVERMANSDFRVNETFVKNREEDYKKLLWYFIYRYFMDSVWEGNILAVVKFSAICVEIIKYAGEMLFQENGTFDKSNQMHLCCLFSREIEHSDLNLETFFDDILLGMI